MSLVWDRFAHFQAKGKAQAAKPKATLYIGGSNLRDFSLKPWTQNFMAGAVLGEFEGWLYLLRAL